MTRSLRRGRATRTKARALGTPITEPADQPLLGSARHVPPADVRLAFVLVTRFLLERADEARTLAERLVRQAAVVDR